MAPKLHVQQFSNISALQFHRSGQVVPLFALLHQCAGTGPSSTPLSLGSRRGWRDRRTRRWALRDLAERRRRRPRSRRSSKRRRRPPPFTVSVLVDPIETHAIRSRSPRSVGREKQRTRTPRPANRRRRPVSDLKDIQAQPHWYVKDQSRKKWLWLWPWLKTFFFGPGESLHGTMKRTNDRGGQATTDQGF